MHHNENLSRLKSKLDNTEKHDSNFRNLCIKNADRSKKSGFYFFHRQWNGGELNTKPPSPPRAYATAARQATKIALGDEGMRRLLASHLTDEQKKQPAEIWQLIESQIEIAAKINSRIHRLEFAYTQQLSEESTTTYVARLRTIAERIRIRNYLFVAEIRKRA